METLLQRIMNLVQSEGDTVWDVVQDAVKSKSSDIWVVSSTWFKKGKKKGPGPSHTWIRRKILHSFQSSFSSGPKSNI